MALILVLENGSGRADANSYASVAICDSYHEGHLYATAWTGATADKKAAALVMATRLINAMCRFAGGRSTAVQALDWPRCMVPDRNGENPGRWGTGLGMLPENAVPACVVSATCEMARELLIADRTGAPQGEGLKSTAVTGSTFVFDKSDRRPVLSLLARSMLAPVVVGWGPGMGGRLIRT